LIAMQAPVLPQEQHYETPYTTLPNDSFVL
jgi:hypothetical protein